MAGPDHARLLASLLIAVLASRSLLAQGGERQGNWGDGSVRERFQVDPEGRKSGPATEYARDGTVTVRCNYKAGNLDGHLERLHPSGKPSVSAEYLNGGLHGPYLEMAADGTRILSAIYHDGVLDGGYQSWHPNGKNRVTASYTKGHLEGPYEDANEDGTQVWTATWKSGKLHGDARLTVKGKIAIAQKWREGEIVLLNRLTPHPRSAEEIRQTIATMLALRAPPMPEIKGPPPPPDPYREMRFAALQRLKAYRYLAGLRYEDLYLDPVFNDLCDAAALVCERLDMITHTPYDPGDLPPGVFEKGHRGAANSNLSFGRETIAETVDGYVDDSDPSNITALGHRRWCLNPPLKKTGFGWSAQHFSAMWSMDASGSVPKGMKTVCWPPAGLVPVDFFAQNEAWSVSFLAGAWPARVTPQVRIDALDERYLFRGAPLATPRSWVASGTYGVRNCIVFDPQAVEVAPGRRYLVTLSLDGGQTTSIEYLVEFFDRGQAETRR